MFSDHAVPVLPPFWGHAAWEGAGGNGVSGHSSSTLWNDGRRDELLFIWAQAVTGGNSPGSATGGQNQIQRPPRNVLCLF